MAEQAAEAKPIAADLAENQFEAYGLPSMYLVDGSGRIAAINDDLGEGKLASLLEQTLGKPSPLQ